MLRKTGFAGPGGRHRPRFLPAQRSLTLLPRRAAPTFTNSGGAVDQLASAVGAGSGDVLQLVIERRSMMVRPVAMRPPRATFTKQIHGAGQLAGARERAPGRRRWHVQQLQAAAAHRGGESVTLQGGAAQAGAGGAGAPTFTKSGSAVDQLASAVGAGQRRRAAAGDRAPLDDGQAGGHASGPGSRRATFTKQIHGAGQLAGARERAPGRRRWHVQRLQAAAAHRGGGEVSTCRARSAHIHKVG